MKGLIVIVVAMGAFAHAQDTLHFTVDFSKRAQTIDNIGSSTADGATMPVKTNGR